jgi:hypothetical protein
VRAGPGSSNYAEGFVLEPNARATPSERFVVKKKTAELDEVVFDESAPGTPTRCSTPRRSMPSHVGW